ncbi:class I SAM-dependent methyltransferase [Cytobacillus sp. IB215316]|uniref:class I SAM-dependent methyltransferase n=1 Tax=Cytobacillus sp. IB215316 TaxID=3097354 RepID=UPI002A10E37A|nr:class I SAM-dependent methyltransferase [Cytobacillus sp. IB215316]MDX8362445.1 class I SAM-dependent methyltransferase [Cytobacillus sp. IB215316]
MDQKLTEKIKKRYNRVSRIFNSMDRMIKESWREDLLKNVKGNVLEVGVGTGANFLFYPDDIHLTCIDFSPGMLKHARNKVNTLSLPYQVTLNEMDAQQMDFPDNTFNYVIATCVYCSVPDPVKGLKEMGRVCKKDGKIIMLEHMRSENEIVGKMMDILNPITVNTWGANVNRKTLDNINSAGLLIEEKDDLFYSIIRKLIVAPIK